MPKPRFGEDVPGLDLSPQRGSYKAVREKAEKISTNLANPEDARRDMLEDLKMRLAESITRAKTVDEIRQASESLAALADEMDKLPFESPKKREKRMEKMRTIEGARRDDVMASTEIEEIDKVNAVQGAFDKAMDNLQKAKEDGLVGIELQDFRHELLEKADDYREALRDQMKRFRTFGEKPDRKGKKIDKFADEIREINKVMDMVKKELVA